MQRDLYNHIQVVELMKPMTVNNDTEGAPADGLLDMQKGDAAVILFKVGASGDTLAAGVNIGVIAQHSDDGTTWVPITNPHHLHGWTPDSNGRISLIDDPAEDDVLLKVGYRGEKRYFRLFADTTGTHTVGTLMYQIGILGNLRLEGSYAVDV